MKRFIFAVLAIASVSIAFTSPAMAVQRPYTKSNTGASAPAATYYFIQEHSPAGTRIAKGRISGQTEANQVGAVAPLAWHYDEDVALYVTVTGSHITDIQVQGVSYDRSGDTNAYVVDSDDSFEWVSSPPWVWNNWNPPVAMGQAARVSYYVAAPDQVCAFFLGAGSPEGAPCMTVRG